MKELQPPRHIEMNIIKTLIVVMLIMVSACKNASSQQENLLKPDAFQKKLAEVKEAQLVDVRTPEEFQRGYLKGALSMNINSDDLKNRSKYLDKEKPLFVYCYSGARSARACDYFRKAGFKIVYDLDGGYSNWTSLNMPVEKPNASTSIGMLKDEYDKIVTSNKKVIVDVYAKWCAPCIKMNPDLKNLTHEYEGKLIFLQIEKDKNEQLAKQLGVTEIPVFLVYKNGKLVMTAEGYRDAKGLRELFDM